MNKIDAYDINTREPESLNVGQLNMVVRALREALYQMRLKAQALEEPGLRFLAKDSDGLVVATFRYPSDVNTFKYYTHGAFTYWISTFKDGKISHERWPE